MRPHPERDLRREERWRRRMHRHHHRPFRGAQLHVRLFWWFGISILMMGMATGTVFWIFGLGAARTWSDDATRLHTFVAGRFERVWSDEAARNELAKAISDAIEVRVSLFDAQDASLFDSGKRCTAPDFSLPVMQNGAAAGKVFVCFDTRRHPGRSTIFLALGSAGFTLWMASLFVARRIGRPLRDLTRVTREIGKGKLGSRVRLGWEQPGELGALAESINDMATRIEKQLGDERELVAAVSHEIRAPLSRLRVLTELLRGKNVDGPMLDKMEREIVEIDSLVGDLLASSRLEFALVTFHPLDAREIAAEAIDRANLPEDVLDVQTSNVRFEGDATLLARALANLLDNAAKHGGGAERMVVRDDGADCLVFEVDDSGPGFSAEVLPRAFQAFSRGDAQRRGSTSLGLGLALVRRIAEAHGGTASAESRPDRGARVAIRLSRRRPGTSADS